ncbi:lymphocyte-specific protein 1 isoform X2 [Dromiciops gliroides]|uniref:lymphocyte-specific protein 1 isoform X2 n=1 Tax=Dromiciops gliroides TaxID=33562 RepID=UPI001CC7EC5E|nr:lymphocyte-specific protein 1 isoform X2 [Dromiciops gliroides]
MNGSGDSGGSSAALLRRHSSKQGLQNLLRLTAQWSVEDEEEAARERRRRERERQLRSQSEDGLGGTSSCPDTESQQPEQEKLLALRPAELEEDEGFSDWSQKPEQRKQRWGPDGSLDGGETPQEESPEYEGCASSRSSHRSYEEEEEEDDPHLSQTKASLSQLYVGSMASPEEAVAPKAIPEEEMGLLGVQAETEGRTALLREADMEEMERQPMAPSPSGPEPGDEQGPVPLSPTTKLIDRTESLNRSIKKSNSVKKSQPALPVSKIDNRLEQYTQAVETSGKTPKLTRQPSVEMPSMTVANSKNLWETGELLAQSSAKSTPCKDIVAGDMSKRSFWEDKGGSKTSSTIKSTPSGKRYKFVATGHGKYEKVLIDEGP